MANKFFTKVNGKRINVFHAGIMWYPIGETDFTDSTGMKSIELVHDEVEDTKQFYCLEIFGKEVVLIFIDDDWMKAAEVAWGREADIEYN